LLVRTGKNAQTVATKTSQKHAGWQIRGKQLGVISGERNFMIQRQISDAGILTLVAFMTR
jgi:hypothetical protein